MNKYVKDFFIRGLMFGGFGPVVLGIVYVVISCVHKGFSLTANEVFLGIISTYILAFLQAGVTVFNQIEGWPVPKSLFCHFSILYLAYTVCYLVNTWIPFSPSVLLIFTVIFVSLFFLIWVIVYFSVKATSKKFNSTLK